MSSTLAKREGRPEYGGFGSERRSDGGDTGHRHALHCSPQAQTPFVSLLGQQASPTGPDEAGRRYIAEGGSPVQDYLFLNDGEDLDPARSGTQTVPGPSLFASQRRGRSLLPTEPLTIISAGSTGKSAVRLFAAYHVPGPGSSSELSRAAKRRYINQWGTKRGGMPSSPWGQWYVRFRKLQCGRKFLTFNKKF